MKTKIEAHSITEIINLINDNLKALAYCSVYQIGNNVYIDSQTIRISLSASILSEDILSLIDRGVDETTIIHRIISQERELTTYVRVFVPATPAPEIGERLAKELAKNFANLFGGSNISTRNGYYYDANGECIEELNYVVECFSNDKERLLSFATKTSLIIKKRMQQECIAIECNGVMTLK